MHCFSLTKDGTVSTLQELDFETDPSCTASVTVFDGSYTSLPGTLDIDVIDVDDPPVMSNTAYLIVTEEVAVRASRLSKVSALHIDQNR